MAMLCKWPAPPPTIAFTVLQSCVAVEGELRGARVAQGSSVVRFSPVDAIVSGSSPFKFNCHSELGELEALCKSKRMIHEVWSNREVISKRLLSVQMSTFKC